MSVAGPSTAILRAACSSSRLACCSASFSTSAQSAERFVPKPGYAVKPKAKGRPKRYTTTYGIPPLHEHMWKSDVNTGFRLSQEGMQRPDTEAIVQLEAEITDEKNPEKKAPLVQKLADLKEHQSRKHPLWAFFHLKRLGDITEETQAIERSLAKEGKKMDETTKHPGADSLAFALESPSRSLDESGRPWHTDELRRKSFHDLHTLWYILVVERNALYTQKEEARRCDVDARSYTFIQEKLHRVRKSMARIKYVIHERRLAIREAQELLKGQKKASNGQVAVYEPPAASFMEQDEQKPQAETLAAPS